MQERTIPAISVVMPAYNAEKYLREAIDSILAQTFTDFEFIIINDGSTDSTKGIIQSYDDPRIVYLENEKNSGICVTLNKGLDAARGRYIARMDADDISLPHRLSTQYTWMESHPDIAVSGSDIEVFGDGIKPYRFTFPHNSDDCSAGLLFNPCFAHPSVIWRTSVMRKLSLKYEPEFNGLEDFRLWWDFAKNSLIANIPKTLLRYRKHISQITQNRSEAQTFKSNKFREERYRLFGVNLSDSDCTIVNDYSYGNLKHFDIEDFNRFINILKKVISCKTHPIITSKYALRVVASKAIAETIKQSPALSAKRKTLITRAFLKGILPVIWYLKFLRYYLFN